MTPRHRQYVLELLTLTALGLAAFAGALAALWLFRA
jgi:hypothetical protein